MDRSERLVASATIGLTILACSLHGAVTPSPIPSGRASAVSVATTVPAPSQTPAPAVVASPQIASLDMLDDANGWAISDTNVLRTSEGGPPGTT